MFVGDDLEREYRPIRSKSHSALSKMPHVDSPVVSMQRALRTLSSPQTPRRSAIDGQQRTKRTSNKSFSLVPTEGRRDISDSSISSSCEESVKVAIRVRPDQCARRGFRVSERNSVVEISDKKRCGSPRSSSLLGRGSEYVYDKVFGEDANTCEIYHELVNDIVESATRDGKNGTVFTYGQTNSGKTYTMQGDGSNATVGIIQIAAKNIFQSIREERSEGSNSEISVKVSYVEIYNESLRDLLNHRQTSTSLIIREDKRGSITVEGQKEVACVSLSFQDDLRKTS